MPQFTFRGRTPDQLKALNRDEFLSLITSRERRALKRGLNADQKALLANIRRDPKKFHRTKSRDMVILPEMIGSRIGIHNGKEFVTVDIIPEMLGRRLGEFSMTRKAVKHSAPGFGATRSSKYIPLK